MHFVFKSRRPPSLLYEKITMDNFIVAALFYRTDFANAKLDYDD